MGEFEAASVNQQSCHQLKRLIELNGFEESLLSKQKKLLSYTFGDLYANSYALSYLQYKI